jgi:ElaB/YqjD/DUF883 family membrane-anchored ribosome-binding protein
MSHETDRMTADLQKFATELEALIADVQKAAGGRISDHVEEASASLRKTIIAAQRRVSDLQAELEHRVNRATRAATESVRDSPWQALATAAAAAFLLGFAVARTASSEHRR